MITLTFKANLNTRYMSVTMLCEAQYFALGPKKNLIVLKKMKSRCVKMNIFTVYLPISAKHSASKHTDAQIPKQKVKQTPRGSHYTAE